MILDKEVMVTVSPRNIYYYENKGYEIPRKIDKRGRLNFTKGTKIKVKIEDLLLTSKVKVRTKCEFCSKEKSIDYDTLAYRVNSMYKITGETLCSGCSNKKRFSGDKSSNYKHGNNRYCEYRYNSSKRGIKFNLTIQEFETLTNEECHYCGGYSIERNEKSRGNGIDRKDSSKGYEISNCVSCCSTCNFIKNNMKYNTFLKYIRRLYEKTKNYTIDV